MPLGDVGNFIEQCVVRKYRSFLVNYGRMRYILTENILLFQYIKVLLTGPTCKFKKINNSAWSVLHSGFVLSFPLRVKEHVERDSAPGVKGTAEILKRKRRKGNTVINLKKLKTVSSF
jgi:hypothetical protein